MILEFLQDALLSMKAELQSFPAGIAEGMHVLYHLSLRALDFTSSPGFELRGLAGREGWKAKGSEHLCKQKGFPQGELEHRRGLAQGR